MKKFLLILGITVATFALASCDESGNLDNSQIFSILENTMTLDELAAYDGLNGNPGYIAVNDIIYDVTEAFPNGQHQGMQLAGKDATFVFEASPHSMELLLSLTAVGRLVDETVVNNQTNVSTTTETLPVFTTDELAAYTGANGSTAYIAVSGVIYDVTAEFVNGTHQGLQLGGTDATAIFAASPHSQSLLETLEVVGTLEGYPTISVEVPVETTDPTTNTNTTDPNTDTNPTDPTTEPTTDPSTEVVYLPVFTSEELAVYTGANGSTAYIAVSGVIYDVTNAFVNGTHQGIQLGGTDATAIFAASPHSQSLLATLNVVGSLEGYDLIVDPSTQTTDPVVDPNATYLPVFTMEELAQYTGANGTPAYLAVSGVVYDGTDEFPNGMHQGFQLGGTDATAIFAASPHSQAILNELPIIGSLEGYPLIEAGSVNNNGGYGDYDDDEYDDEYDDDDDYDDEYDDEYDDDGDYDDEYVSTSSVPQAILDYISQNYANTSIDEIEMEDGMYEVELTNDIELYFDLSGNFLGMEYDD